MFTAKVDSPVLQKIYVMQFLRITIIFLFNVALFVLLFTFCEFAIRIINPAYVVSYRTFPGQFKNRDFPTYTSRKDRKSLHSDPWLRRDPDLGWVCNNNQWLTFANSQYNNQLIVYRRNKQGFRCEKDFYAPIDTSKTRVMLLGDSYLFGVYLKEEDALHSLLQRKLGKHYEFYNLGIPGWGLDQMFLSYKKYRDVIKPHIVILFYIDFDIHRAFQAFRWSEGMNKPSFTVKKNKLVLRGPESPGFIEKLFFKSFILNTFYKQYEIRASMRIAKALYSEMIKDTSERGETFVVIRCPMPQDLKARRSSERYSFNTFFMNKPGAYLELFDKMIALPDEKYNDLYLVNDFHLSALGTEFTADYIVETVFNKQEQ